MAVEQWQVDTAHSSVEFSVKHMMFARVRGRFNEWEATVELDPTDLSTLRVEATVQVESIDTGSEKRDEHLRSQDFFAAEEKPVLHFRSERAEADGDEIKLHGQLTMAGASKPVTLQVERTGQGVDPWGNQRMGFRATTTIDREDWNIEWNQALETGGVLIGKNVDIEVEAQVLKPSAGG